MARTKDLYKPSRRKNGEGVGKFCTVNLKEDIAIEFKLLVKAYSEVYGQKMTPTQVIKRLMDAGVKRCDPDVYAVFSRLKEEGTPEPVLEITHPVDPTEGEVWEMKYFFEKALLKTENNGIYFGKDGYLMTKFVKPDESRLNINYGAVEKLSDSLDIPVKFSLIPMSSYVHADKLPHNANPYNQQILFHKKVSNYLQ